MEKILYDKYKGLASEENESAKIFLNKIITHHNNPNNNKSILIFPGRWEGLGLREAISLGQKILQDAKFDVFVAALAHPLTTNENAHELNPHLSGNGTVTSISERFLFETPVGLGEKMFTEINFNLSHNTKKLFFLKISANVISPTSTTSMFRTFTPVTLKGYTGPVVNPTGSEISDQYILASVPKGEKKFFDSLPAAGIHRRLLPDPDRQWPNFHNLQLFSPEISVSKETVSSLLEAYSGDGKNNPFLGKGLCDPSTLITPCGTR